MKKQRWAMLGLVLLAVPDTVVGQVDLSRATYIGVEQWRDTINALPGIDRQIVSQDIGELNLSVGIIHRGPTTGATGQGGGGAADSDCGVASGPSSGARGIQHLH